MQERILEVYDYSKTNRVGFEFEFLWFKSVLLKSFEFMVQLRIIYIVNLIIILVNKLDNTIISISAFSGCIQ